MLGLRAQFSIAAQAGALDQGEGGDGGGDLAAVGVGGRLQARSDPVQRSAHVRVARGILVALAEEGERGEALGREVAFGVARELADHAVRALLRLQPGQALGDGRACAGGAVVVAGHGAQPLVAAQGEDVEAVIVDVGPARRQGVVEDQRHRGDRARLIGAGGERAGLLGGDLGRGRVRVGALVAQGAE